MPLRSAVSANRIDDAERRVVEGGRAKSQSLLNCTGARLAPPRASFWKFPLASHRHASEKRLASELVKTSGRSGLMKSRSVRSSVSLK